MSAKRLPVPTLPVMCRRCFAWIPAPFESLAIFDGQEKVSELSVKCVFGLHRRERIACATFYKRVQKVTLQKCSFWLFFGSFASAGCPRESKEVSIGSSRYQNVCSKTVKMPSDCPRRVTKEVFGWPRWVGKHKNRESSTNLLASIAKFHEMSKEMSQISAESR